MGLKLFFIGMLFLAVGGVISLVGAIEIFNQPSPPPELCAPGEYFTWRADDEEWGCVERLKSGVKISPPKDTERVKRLDPVSPRERALFNLAYQLSEYTY